MTSEVDEDVVVGCNKFGYDQEGLSLSCDLFQ